MTSLVEHEAAADRGTPWRDKVQSYSASAQAAWFCVPSRLPLPFLQYATECAAVGTIFHCTLVLALSSPLML
jgi:hypothetical protein